MSFLFSCRNFCAEESRENELTLPVKIQFKPKITRETQIQISSEEKEAPKQHVEVVFDIHPLTLISHKNDIIPKNSERLHNKHKSKILSKTRH